ncbi:MAG: PAS domain S-box protein [Cyanobacteria bacterium J06638_28]
MSGMELPKSNVRSQSSFSTDTCGVNSVETLIALTPLRVFQSLPDNCPEDSETTLDLVAVLQTAQQFSATLQIDEVLSQFVCGVLQHSGGDRCAVVLANDDEAWQVEAIATPHGTERCQSLLEDCNHVPVQLIQYVQQSQRGVLFNNLATDLPVLDTYLRQRHPRSCLCLPLFHEARLMGALYVSHASQSGTFTSSRIHSLNFLCAQAIKAFVNAQLYVLEQKQARSLQATESPFKIIFEKATNAVLLLGKEGVIDCNQATLDLFGYTNKSQLHLVHLAQISPEFQPDGQRSQVKVNRIIQTALKQGRHHFEWVYQQANGASFWAEVILTAVPYGEDNILHCVVQDIRDRKAAEASLKQSEEKFRTLVENINGAVYRCQNNADWTMAFVSEAIAELTGYTAAEFMSNERTYASIIHPDDVEYVDSNVAQTLADREPFTLEYRLIHRDGSIRWIYEKGKGIFDTAGQLLFIEGVFFDITDVKTAQAEKATSQEKLEFLIQKTTLGVIEWNTQFKVAAWNPAAEIIFGYSADEMLDQPAQLIVPPAIRPLINDIMTALVQEEGGNYSINENVTKEGETITCEWINTVLYDSQQKVLGIYSIVQDITARIQAEAALKQSEATLRRQAIALTELSQSPAISQGQVDLAFREITERTAQTLQVSRVSIWLFDPSGTKLICRNLFELATQHHAVGSELLVADYPDYFAALAREGNFAVKDARHDVRTCEFAESYLIPLDIHSILDAMLGSDGKTAGVLCLEAVGKQRCWRTAEENFARSVANLVTLVIAANERQQQAQKLEQTLDKLQRTQLQLVQSEKMSSVGQLVAGVAHEINNPVSFIHGNLTHADGYVTDLLHLIHQYQSHYPDPHPDIADEIEAIDLTFVQKDLEKVLKSMRVGTERIRSIVNSLRNFSRLDEAEVKNVNLHEGIDNTLLILRTRLRAQDWRPEILVHQDYGDLPVLKCHAGQLNQVFMNLLSNAIDALEEQDAQRSREQLETHPSTIQIRTQLLTQADTPAILISFADNGPGMDKATRDRLFTPFFTTKPVGKGTGLGLSISYQIITEKHGGSITCDSAIGQGTTFTITLPLRQ